MSALARTNGWRGFDGIGERVATFQSVVEGFGRRFWVWLKVADEPESVPCTADTPVHVHDEEAGRDCPPGCPDPGCEGQLS